MLYRWTTGTLKREEILYDKTLKFKIDLKILEIRLKENNKILYKCQE